MSSARVQKASEHITQAYIASWIGVENDTIIARLAMEGGVAENNVLKSMTVLHRLVVNIEALVWDDLILGLVKEEDMIDDRRKVGDNCISFYNEDRSLKIKVYNKFGQMLKSCDIMTVLGSRIHNIFVDPPLSLQYTMKKTSDTGVTRFEIKIYGQEIRSLLWYLYIFDEVKYNLKGCSFYRCSF